MKLSRGHRYFLICLTSALKSLSALMFALALYLRDTGQVPLSLWRFGAWIVFSAFFIFSSGSKVPLDRHFQFEGTFSCRLKVCTFTWLVAEFSSSLTVRSSSSLMVFSGSICTSWFEVLGTARYPSSLRVLSDIVVFLWINGRQDRNFYPSFGSLQLPIQKEDDKPTPLLQFVAFVHLPFSFRSLDLFVASLLFRKGTSFCVTRRK